MGGTRRYRVHLSGPLSGCNEHQRRLWRDDFARSCRLAEPIDPSEWGDEWDFTRDLAAISTCDVLVANMWKESIGTTLEIMHARSRGKPVVLIDQNDLEHSILGGLVAPEKPVSTVKEAAARVDEILKDLDGFNVQKRDGTLEPFDRDKLARAIRLACAEAGVDDLEFPNQLIGPVVAALSRRDDAGEMITTERIRLVAFGELDRLGTSGSGKKAVAEVASRVKAGWQRRERYKQGDGFFHELEAENATLRARVGELTRLCEELQSELAERNAVLTEVGRRPESPPPPAPTSLQEALPGRARLCRREIPIRLWSRTRERVSSRLATTSKSIRTMCCGTTTPAMAPIRPGWGRR